MQDFIDSLDLPFEGKMQGKEYIIELDNSNDFSKLYNIIALNRDLERDEDSVATTKETKFVFTNGVYECKLEANYDKDYYKLTIGER